MKSFVRAAAIFAVLITSPVQAETWTVIYLHPPNTSDSAANGVAGGQQAGTVAPVGPERAAIWSGTRQSFIDLHPGEFGSSRIRATSGSQQAGSVGENGAHATIWSGSAASAVDLHPVGADSSTANATTGVQQAGSASYETFEYACIWTGTRASYTDLQPVGADSSRLYATTGAQQAGSATFGGSRHAGLWSGTFQSFQDLHPVGAQVSEIYGMAGNQQVGFATVGNPVAQHAAIWAGTRESFVDLHPAGSDSSVLRATNGDRQVGYVYLGANSHAGIWTGSAASFVDLHAKLPAHYTTSLAEGIANDGATLQVAGSALNSTTGRREAILWQRKAHRPTVRITGRKTTDIQAAKLLVRGTARDRDDDLSRVTIKVGRAKWKKARGVEKWRAGARIEPGRTIVRARAIDSFGARSKAARITVVRPSIDLQP